MHLAMLKTIQSRHFVRHFESLEMSSARKRARLPKKSVERPAGVPSIKLLFQKGHERNENASSHARSIDDHEVTLSNRDGEYSDASTGVSGYTPESRSLDISSDSESECEKEPAPKMRKTSDETSVPTDTISHTCSASIWKRKFPSTWLKTYGDWLEFDSVNYVMFCKLCRKHKKPGIWATCGTDNFRYVDLDLFI